MESSHRGEAWGWVQVRVRVRVKNLREREVVYEWKRKQCRTHLRPNSDHGLRLGNGGWMGRMSSITRLRKSMACVQRGMGLGESGVYKGGSRGEEGGFELAGAHH